MAATTFQVEPREADRAIVLHPFLRSDAEAAARADSRLEEAVGLTAAIGLDVRGERTAGIAKIQPASYVGRGLLDELAADVAADEIDVVIFDCALSPGQQRSLERALETKVIDRTALILEIFGARARTREGRLQVELAHLTYQRSRLVRSWTHLERQRGGAGFMGGPGERQIELDRRLIDDRITRLKRDLETVRQRRDLQRAARRKVPYPVVALVGYTNAGKSTLFNRLTGADVLAEDLLFATLDPTMRRIDLPNGQTVILSDTVGFISELPTQLVAAFRATLEEVTGATVILHVRDISHPDTDLQAASVLEILAELGVETENGAAPIEVLNKIDLLPQDQREVIETRASVGNSDQILVSALTGEGCDRLLERLAERIGAGRVTVSLTLAHADGRPLAWLYDHGEVLDRRDGEEATELTVSLDPANWARFGRKFPGQVPEGADSSAHIG